MTDCQRAYGVVVEEGTDGPLAGLVVKAVMRVGRGWTTITQTTTDDDGRFSFDARANLPPGASGIYRIEVYQAGTKLEAHGDVTWHTGQVAHGMVICVTLPQRCAEPPDEPPGTVTIGNVHGVVRHDDGTPQESVWVRLTVADYSGEADVDEVQNQAGEEGWFNFGTPALTLPADVRVKVYEEMPDTTMRLVGSSRVHYGYNGGPLRFEVYLCDDALRGPSEFARITEALSRAIFPAALSHPDSGLGAALLTMDARKAAWASRKTEWPFDKVVDRALAEKLDDSMSHPSSPLGASPLYGLLREGFPRRGDEILARGPSLRGSTCLT